MRRVVRHRVEVVSHTDDHGFRYMREDELECGHMVSCTTTAVNRPAFRKCTKCGFTEAGEKMFQQGQKGFCNGTASL